MKSLSAYIKRRPEILFFLYWPFHFLWYELVITASDHMPRFFLVSSPLDAYIPFCEWFIIPYSVWYPYIFAVLIYTFLKNKKDFYDANRMIVGSMFFPMLFATIFPNGLHESVRAPFDEFFASLGRDNILIDAVKVLYTIDYPPRAVMPSMHVTVSVALFFVVCRAQSLRGKWAVKTIATVTSILICMSIVMIKQHSVIDGFAGIGVAVVLYLLNYHCLPFFMRRRKAVG